MNIELNALVSSDWLFKHLNHPNLIILDASPSDIKSNLIPEFTDIRVSGARFFDIEKVFFDKQSTIANMIPSSEDFEKSCRNLGINKNSIIVVYDNLGIYMSPRVWWMFKTMGHDQIAVLDGGLTAWKNMGYPIEAIKFRTYQEGDFKANYQSEMVRNSTFILEKHMSDQCTILDARGAGRFTGALPEPRPRMESGHIPNSVNLPFKEVLRDGFMKSKEELESILSTFDVKKNQELIFTCGSGVTACIILLACSLVFENKKSLFDGSWSEWGQEGKFPVEEG